MRPTKLMIVAAICLVAGIVIFTIGFGMVGFDGTKLATEPVYTEKDFHSSEVYETIMVNDKNTSIEVVPSKDDDFHLSYFENENKTYTIEEDDLTLTVRSSRNKKWYHQFFNLTFESEKQTTLQIPERFLGKVSLQTSNSDVYVSDVSTTDMEIETTNDDIIIENVSASGTLTTDSSNGRVEIVDSVIDGNLTCDTNNREVSVMNTTCANLSIDTNNGAVELTNTVVANEGEITTSNDDISLAMVAFGTGLDCENANGEITGTIVGKLSDFTITSQTSNGENNLPTTNTEGDKKLKLITSNDDINIVFAEGLQTS